MSSLFVINRSLHDQVWVFEQIAFASNGDSILFVEDAVLALHSPISLGSFLAKCAAMNISVHALKSDCELRGIASKYKSVSMVDYAGYVDLVTKHNKQVAW